MRERSGDRGRPIKRVDPEWTAWFDRMVGQHDWFMSQPKLVEQYLGKVVVLYDHAVVGCGRDHPEASEDVRRRAAERQQPAPPEGELMFVPVPEQIWFDDLGFLLPSTPPPNGESSGLAGS